MRISLLLAREDNPKLFDELAQFPKGPRRVNRLRTIAYDGLLAQQNATAIGTGAPGIMRSRSFEVSPSERAKASLELFAEPMGEPR